MFCMFHSVTGHVIDCVWFAPEFESKLTFVSSAGGREERGERREEGEREGGREGVHIAFLGNA